MSFYQNESQGGVILSFLEENPFLKKGRKGPSLVQNLRYLAFLDDVAAVEDDLGTRDVLGLIGS